MDSIDADHEVIDIADDSDVVAEAPQDVEPDSDVVVVDDSEAVAADTSENHEEAAEKEENGENGGEEGNENPYADEDDSDEDGGGVQVTIRKIEPTEKPAARQGKLDIDATPLINDKPIYDIDLAQMEDRPWRKPGADITDYFNYGFTEDTWNMYCERQKKVRIEFSGNQQAANNALFSSIKVTNPLANPVMNTNNSPASVVKVLTDNGGRFKQPTYSQPSHQSNDQVIRTVITGNTAPPPMAPNSLMDFTKPPPGMSLPPMGMPPVSLPTSAPDIFSDAPPGVDGGADRPPGVESSSIPGVLGVPGVSGIPGVPGVPGGLDLHLGLPPMGFNPNMPPPGMNLGMMATNLPPPSFNMPPPSFQAARAGFAQVGMGGGPRGMMPPGPSFNREISDEDDERRQRRKRSRSRSPRRGDRDRDSRRRGERESERVSSRRHRSRSTSRDRRRRDDREREKRRERRDDDDRSKKRSRHDDDERRESSSRKEKKIKQEEESTESTGAPNESPVVE